MTARAAMFALRSAALAVAVGACVGAAPAAAHEGVARPAVRAHASIIGGQPVPQGQISSVADIVDIHGKEGDQCTGTVVAPTLVLTAGHCAVDARTGALNSAHGYQVLTGTASGEGTEGQVSTVSGVLLFEGYRRRVDTGDAALLVLSSPTMAPPIAIATTTQIRHASAGMTATVVGWGDTRFAQPEITMRLHSAETVVQSKHWCVRNARPFFARSEICAIDPPAYSTGACHGDSGGPLLAPVGEAGAVVVIGVTVHGYARCSTRMPTVYTRADRLAAWVRTWIAAYTPPAVSTPAPASPEVPATPSP
ncbi:MAG TPA: trypsin-like serine protease [Solirubrobacteraceae bacterium]|jgi:secreted trypsin-like serine protease|nr:trypsin-like serine protease [Solirubrobacteraceae bacterium]